MFIKVFGGEVKGEEPLALNPETRIAIFLKPKKGDSPQRAQREIKIKQGKKLLFSALLFAPVK